MTHSGIKIGDGGLSPFGRKSEGWGGRDDPGISVADSGFTCVGDKTSCLGDTHWYTLVSDLFGDDWSPVPGNGLHWTYLTINTTIWKYTINLSFKLKFRRKIKQNFLQMLWIYSSYWSVYFKLFKYSQQISLVLYLKFLP